ncbi:MAG: hypothetical protein DRI72_00840 [Bacteroidetes bacterium]|nr:MAG: hypothetical protein DRI72_00840 [Bacteroidota bacterium]RLD74465.1 MAG: hypothetical protein DRI87_00860 [Bacteroidota bacterium]
MNTNKLYILIIVLIFLIPNTHSLYAQESNKGKINFGFDGGVQFTNTNNKTTLNPTSRKTGYILGPYAEYFISDLFSVKLGLYFDNRGFKIDDLYVGLADSSQIIPDSIVYSAKSYLHITRNYSINYLTIPLSISYVKGSGKFKIYVQAGVYYSLLLNATQKGFNDLYIDPEYAPHFSPPFDVPGHSIEDFTGDATSIFNTYDFGMNLYLGGIVQISPHWGLTVTPGFAFSFTNLYYQPEIEAKWTQIFQLKAGVVYTLNRDK